MTLTKCLKSKHDGANITMSAKNETCILWKAIERLLQTVGLKKLSLHFVSPIPSVSSVSTFCGMQTSWMRDIVTTWHVSKVPVPSLEAFNYKGQFCTSRFLKWGVNSEFKRFQHPSPGRRWWFGLWPGHLEEARLSSLKIFESFVSVDCLYHSFESVIFLHMKFPSWRETQPSNKHKGLESEPIEHRVT